MMAGGGIRKVAEAARAAYLALLGCTEEDKNAALRGLIAALARRRGEILAANARDCAAADELVAAGRMTAALRARLVFDDAKLAGAVAGLEQVLRLPDPANRVLWTMELDEGLTLRRVSCALGVIGVVFESRPDVVVQVSGLLLKAGNAGILKGGKEAQATNAALMAALREGLAASPAVSVDALQLLSTREEVRELLACDAEVDLLIPRGGKELVKQIQAGTRIPVLGHADGVCHVYVHEAADLAKAQRIVVDAKTEYPAVCNAAETVLFDRGGAARLLPPVVRALMAEGVEVRGCPETRALVPEAGAAGEDAWSAEYLDLIASVRVVADLAAAAAHINRYGSHHTDAIVTEDEAAAAYFCRYVDSAGVFVNASTRFADGFRYGLGAEIGISTGKIHARGPVGLEGIVTYKYELRGAGHAVGDYGPGKRSYTHRTPEPGAGCP